jgi:flagellar basal-body rod protein FlgG
MPTSINQLWNVAGSGVHSQQRYMEVVSHNIANNNTIGFKASQARFQAVIREATLNAEDAGLFVAAQPGDVIQEGMGTLLTATSHAFYQGSLQSTGEPFHMAISGEGFFQVTNPEGQVRYTRAGDFQRDAEGRLVNSQGHFLTPPITIPEEVTETYVDADGRVLGAPANEGEAPQLFGTVQIASFANEDGLVNVGENSFVPGVASGPAELGAPGAGQRGLLRNGFLENSNVDLGREMVTMLRTHRTYSLSLRALSMADRLHGMANELPRS